MAQSLISEEKVFNELRKAIVETLRVEEDSVRPESSLINDLGAESLDFLDINYRMEQVFGIKMARHFVLEHIEELFGEGSAIDEDGRLTDKAVELLKIRFGKDMPELEPGTDMEEVPALVTAGSIVQGVMDILDSLPEKCTACGNGTWKTDDGAKVLCSSCGKPAEYKNGDDLTVEWLKKVQEDNKIF